MQLLFELHFMGLCIGVIHLHQCISNFLGWFYILITYNHGIKHIHKKPIQDFPNFFMLSFTDLNLLLCGVFWDRRFFLTTSFKLPIAFPIKKFIILNFHTWKLFLFNFSIAIWKRLSIIFQGNTQCLLGVSQMICFKKLFYFLPWVYRVRIRVFFP